MYEHPNLIHLSDILGVKLLDQPYLSRFARAYASSRVGNRIAQT